MIAQIQTNLNCTRNPRDNTAIDPYARQKRYVERKRIRDAAQGKATRPKRMAERVPGPKSLLVAVVEQAITDYFILKRMGAVNHRQVTGKWKDRKAGGKNFQNMQPSDAQPLLDFLRDEVGTLFDLADVDLPNDLAWRGILNLEKSGRWRQMFGKGASLNVIATSDDCDMVDA